MRQSNFFIFTIALAVLVAGCTPMQKSSVELSGEYTLQVIASGGK